MFPWSFSWLPKLPSVDFSLSSGIEKRFVAFALRQALGHLLKPGQLDAQQVDSQIGSGYVQVRDLELDDEAINALISGLPIRLRDGSVGKVTARMPWPNPLSSFGGLSLESLHLTFYLEPTLASPSERPFTDNLAESVASVAETFIHEELTARKEATLRNPLNLDLSGSESSIFQDNVPGGLDPFISEEEVHQHDLDPPGVSIITTLIERLIARFRFDATDTRITIVNPQQASFTLIVPEIRCAAEPQGVPPVAVEGGRAISEGTPPLGDGWKLAIIGATVTTRCLRPMSPSIPLVPPRTNSPMSAGPVSPQMPSSTTASSDVPVSSNSLLHEDLVEKNSPPFAIHQTPPSPELSSPPVEPSSPYSDSSDMDEETQMFMSQSIALLPPRPVSPASSVASSMYQSAVSTAPPEPTLDDIPEEESPSSRNRTPPPPLSHETPEVPVSSREHTPEPTSEPTPEPISSGSPRTDSLPSLAPIPTEGQRSPSQSPVHPFQRRLDNRTGDVEDETVLSLGAEPIEILMTIPPSFEPPVNSSSQQQQDSRSVDKTGTESRPGRRERIRIDLSMGTIACAFSARQIRSIIDISELWSSHCPPLSRATAPAPGGDSTSAFPFGSLDGSLRIRGIVTLLLPSRRSPASNPDDVLTEFFARPVIPPPLLDGYARVHVDGISGSLTMRRVVKGRQTPAQRETPSMSASLTVSDISVFAFLRGLGANSDMTASPVLITDPHLSAQYPLVHFHPSLDASSEPSSLLPTFDVVDWTDPGQRSTTAKLSLWRTKPPPSGRVSSSPAQNEIRQSPSSMESPLRQGADSSSPSSRRPMPVTLPSSPGRIGLTGFATSPGKGSQPTVKVSHPALTVKFRSVSHHPKDQRGDADAPDLQVNLAPLHLFLDVGAALSPAISGKSETLRFIDELIEQSASTQAGGGVNTPGDQEHSEDSEDEGSRPGTPQASGAQALREQEAERERRRLERLVLEDLDLGFDYRQPETHPQTTSNIRVPKPKKKRSKAPGLAVTVNFPAIRAEVRVPPPVQRSSRSGAVVFDVHGLCLSLGRAPERGGSTTRFGTAEDLYGADPAGRRAREEDNILLGATCKRIVISHSLVGGNKARAILSLGPLTTQESQSAYFGAGTTPPARDVPSHTLQPQLVLSRTDVSSVAVGSVTSTAISFDIPSVHVELSKPLIDGLQFWADDLTQLMEAAFAEPAASETGTERAGNSESSMIGSRYFARSSTMGSAPDSGVTSLAATMRVRQEPRSETAVKVTVTEAAVRLLVPRDEDGPGAVRPFDLAASDVDVLLELKPEGKDETVVTVGVMDLNVHDLSPTGRNCFLSLTTPRSLNTTIRSALKLRFTSLVVPETTAKESRVRLTLCGVTYHFYPDLKWAANLGRFFKAPPGAFESVVPSERTRVNVKVMDTSIRLLAPSHPGAIVPYIGELDFSTVIEGNSPTTSLNLSIPALALLLIDDLASTPEDTETPSRSQGTMHGAAYWKLSGYALLMEVSDLMFTFKKIDSISPPDIRLLIEQGDLRLHMCADTMGALGAFIGDFSSAFKPQTPETPPEVKRRNEPANVSEKQTPARSLLASLDDHAFRRLPEVGAAPDMIEDDLPTNPDYLDESFGAAAGLRELSDDEFDESDIETSYTPSGSDDPRGITSSFGGETIRLLRPEGINVVENYFEILPPDLGEPDYGDTTTRVRVHDFNITVFLYDGYDWVRTRKTIEEKAKEMRRKLAKIRQLVASGQTPDPSVEETNALLFNSVYIGLEHNVDELEPGALIAAIDEELNEDFETTTQSSWQSLKPQPLASPGRGGSQSAKTHRRRLRRAKGPSLEIKLIGLDAEVDNYRDDASLVSRVLATVRDAEIMDHIKTSTWKKFLTSLQTDSRGNVRESDSNMVRVELRTLHPVPGHPSEEARLRAKILPLRLHVDQDAVDFLKQFFSFKDPDTVPSSPSEPSKEIYFQQAEVFPIDIKLDYKPRRVDYRALKEGRTIELMNFFHFDGAEMTLRHITLNGITGWPRFFDLLNDLWTPDVKATQLVEVISGVAPIRSVVNVGSGVADLVLLPIAQYKKDGRVVRGLQKGANAFIKSTGMEAIRLGARLATGTQVILEQAETVLGGQFKDQVTAEALQIPVSEIDEEDLDEDAKDLISKYADQPTNVKEGMKSAYNSLKKNLNSAAQTILAVPMEVYERSGNEGPVRAVVRAVPIAVLKPMIGASEAVSKTLLGLQNTLDPNIRQENEAKYKRR